MIGFLSADPARDPSPPTGIGTPVDRLARSDAGRIGADLPRARRLPAGRFITVTCATLGFALLARPATPQQVNQNLWGVDGVVSSIVRSGNTLYVGGDFLAVGPVSGGGVPLDRLTGAPVGSFSRVAGVVKAVLADGSGGWYIGGSFAAVGGLPRSNLAHILPDGSVGDWAPNADGEVLALARSGQTLYAGGDFTRVGGQGRSHIAALDLATGRATGWDPAADLAVHALLVHRNKLYVGGEFSNIGGQARAGLAELDWSTGQATTWNPVIEGGSSPVRALAALGDTIYIGEALWSGATQSHHLAAVSATTGSAAAWNPLVTGPIRDSVYGDPYISAMAIRGNTIYLGGHFTGIAGQVRGGLAQVDLATGRTTDWNPDFGPWYGLVGPDILAIAATESTLYAGGYLTSAGGLPRNYVAEVSLTTGLATAWNPNANDAVLALAVDNRAVFAGGAFTGLGSQWVHRKCLAAFDATTGAVKDWNPSPEGFGVGDVVVTHGKVYVGGNFDFIGGQVRYGLAALDTLTGAATIWDPSANGPVGRLVATGDALYASGSFTTMSGQPRGRLASFDLTTGDLTSWNPNAASDVNGLAVHGNIVYVAGFFWTIGGVTRKGIAAVDAATGAVLDWDPQTDNTGDAVVVVGDTVFVGGRFDTIGGQPRTNLAALDAVTGQATGWIADANSEVGTMVTIGDTLFVAGSFFNIAGEPRSGLAAFDLATGALLPWDPEFSITEWLGWGTHPGAVTLLADGSTLYVGGLFGRIGGIPAANLTAISFIPPAAEPPPLPPALALAQVVPNPVHTGATIRFALPSAGPVSLTVFDVQGREIASLLNHEQQTAGWHQVAVRAEGWREGFYFCRLEAGGKAATRKMVVLK